jgi:hypothetical protein
VTLLTVAAQLRAAGASWETIAARVKRSARTCRHWPVAYPDEWRRRYRQAEALLFAEAGAEALLILRAQLRSQNEKISLAAAQFLLKNRTDLRAQEDRAAAAGPGALDAEITRFVAHVRDLSDAQLDALVDGFVARRRLAADGGAAGAAPPPGPALPE